MSIRNKKESLPSFSIRKGNPFTPKYKSIKLQTQHTCLSSLIKRLMESAHLQLYPYHFIILFALLERVGEMLIVNYFMQIV